MKKRAVRKADRLAAEDRVANFLAAHQEHSLDDRRADRQRIDLGAGLILIGEDAVPPQGDKQFHRRQTPPNVNTCSTNVFKQFKFT